MPLSDYLIPGEEIRFQSGSAISFGGKNYRILITSKRLLLYAERGFSFLKRDDVVSFKMDELQGIKYREEGIINKKGILEIHGKTLVQLSGRAAETKALYQQLLQFL
ncbi:MAG: hypothetical protein ABSB40_11670 [Nitrososphaeria archaeon]|jgi:hypothetical protein